MTAAGVHALTCLTRLQSLSIVDCPLVQHQELKSFVVEMRRLGALGVGPEVVKRLRKYQRARRDMLLDDGVCRQM